MKSIFVFVAVLLSMLQPLHASAKVFTTTKYGDSTQYGLVRPNNSDVGAYRSPNSPPLIVPVFLKSIFPQAQIIVTDQSVPGTTLHQLITGTDGKHLPIYNETAIDSNEVAEMNFGINDAWYIVYGGQTLEQYQADLQTFINTKRGYGKAVVLEEPNPVCSDAAVSATLDKIVQIIDDTAIANNVPLVGQYQYIKSLPNWQSMLPDCIHPNDSLYSIKSQRSAYILSTVFSGM
jgi:hypothetical protein